MNSNSVKEFSMCKELQRDVLERLNSTSDCSCDWLKNACGSNWVRSVKVLFGMVWVCSFLPSTRLLWKSKKKMGLKHVHYSATLVGPTLRAHCTRRQTAWTECLVTSDPVTFIYEQLNLFTYVRIHMYKIKLNSCIHILEDITPWTTTNLARSLPS